MIYELNKNNIAYAIEDDIITISDNIKMDLREGRNILTINNCKHIGIDFDDAMILIANELGIELIHEGIAPSEKGLKAKDVVNITFSKSSSEFLRELRLRHIDVNKVHNVTILKHIKGVAIYSGRDRYGKKKHVFRTMKWVNDKEYKIESRDILVDSYLMRILTNKGIKDIEVSSSLFKIVE